ncbi:Uncharacterised protein [Streptococcus pneumoniae]|nr:Uncharacterised protein [Streptococcus pneumoniae]
MAHLIVIHADYLQSLLQLQHAAVVHQKASQVYDYGTQVTALNALPLQHALSALLLILSAFSYQNKYSSLLSYVGIVRNVGTLGSYDAYMAANR